MRKRSKYHLCERSIRVVANVSSGSGRAHPRPQKHSAPSLVRVGDRICVFYNGFTPFIIRPLPDGEKHKFKYHCQWLTLMNTVV